MVKKKDNFEKFVKQLFEYYATSLERISDSISFLSTIQKKYPKDYDKFMQMSHNPEILLIQSGKLNDKEKALLLEILLKINSLTSKSNNLYSLTSKEKEIFAKDLKDYVKMLKAKIK